jgi:hypothetical protein
MSATNSFADLIRRVRVSERVAAEPGWEDAGQ